jgi:hypothetical protein
MVVKNVSSGLIEMHIAWTPELKGVITVSLVLIGMHIAWMPELKGVITVSSGIIGMHIAWTPELKGVITELRLVLVILTALMVRVPLMT